MNLLKITIALKKIIDVGTDPEGDVNIVNQIRFSNIIALISMSFIMLYSIIFYFTIGSFQLYLSVLFFFIFMTVIIFNKYGLTNISRVFITITGNIIIAVYSIIFGEDSHIYIFFLVWISIPLLLYKTNEKYKIFISFITTIFCIAFIESFYFFIDYKPITYNPLSLSGDTNKLYSLFFFISVFCLHSFFVYMFIINKNKYEEALKLSNIELTETTSHLIQAEKMTALGDLSSGIAHELNQPLNIIKIICQSIVRDINNNNFNKNDAAVDLPQILMQVDRMAEIIDHMKLYSKNYTNLPAENQDINNIIRNVLIFFEEQYKNMGIILILELHKNLPQIFGFKSHIEQFFTNLLLNARDAVESSGKRDKIIRIKTRISDNNESIIIEISDNGTGINPNILNRIFDPFFTTKDPGEGTGLGLSVASKIIKNHGGNIDVTSNLNEGTTFFVKLPVI